MKLEDIGFYTLCDERVQTSSETTSLKRCELILTEACNFNCPYCMKLKKDIGGTLKFDKAMEILNYWIAQGLENVRFSGGEPTLYKNLDKLVNHCKINGVKRIAISTNGSNELEYYKELCSLGVNDFSISLDSACCAVGDQMAGNIQGSWNKVVDNIKEISKFCYVTVGMVFTEANINDAIESIKFASSLGVADIRIISSAQYNQAIENLQELPQEILAKHPILCYRVQNYLKGRKIRGLDKQNCGKCKLVLDDMAVAQDQHFPCIIYMRQRGESIGKVGPNMRQERKEWYEKHDSFLDPICRSTCLDVCVDFNDKAQESDLLSHRSNNERKRRNGKNVEYRLFTRG